MLPFVAVALATVFASFLIAWLLASPALANGRVMDWPGAIQKFHLTPTPRVGGVGIYLALLVARVLMPEGEPARILQTVLVAGAPALVSGLLEDVTKRVGVRSRLAATFSSGVLACWLSALAITHVNVPFVDAALAVPAVAVLFTAFAVAGLANAVNIIDGFNGLASGATSISLAALAGIAASVGDLELVTCISILAAAVLGFALVNFPWGKLFLGDGGAYFSGFALAWMAVLVPMRNPDVSPWASFLACAYPIIEVVYSVARRWRLRQPAGEADRDHLHSLVATRVIQPRLPRLDIRLQNASVSVLMWACAAIPALAGVVLYDRTRWLALGAGCCFLLYHWLYRYVARL